MARVFFVAGESSGDIHGSNLIRALLRIAPEVECEGLGGRLMEAAGMTLRHDLASQAIMGFSEVFRQILSIRRLFLDTVDHLRQNRPDCLVVIDYPGFNIRLAQRAKAMGIPVVYYISPQVWAWKKKRIHTIAACVRKMLAILPFEEKLYHDIGADCTYVGHPLLDHIAAFKSAGMFCGKEMVIGLLPGSRTQEISRLMGVMIETARGIREKHPEARFIVPCVSAVRERQVRELSNGFPLETCIGHAYEVLSAARFCLVASGTATLETALFKVPLLLLYKTSSLNYWLARYFIKIRQIGIVNILAGRAIIPEYIQGDASADRLIPHSLDLIGDTPARAQMLEDFEEVRKMLGDAGASDRAAREVLAVLEETRHG